jgi:large subunit ribosomal protein L35
MPKMKTKRSTAKRFKVTGSGKLVRHHAYHSHILTHKTTKQKRRLRKAVVADKTVVKELKRCMPYA